MPNGDCHLCPVILDGGTTTTATDFGYDYCFSFEEWAISNKEKIKKIQKSFIQAGSEIILTPTIGANPMKLAENGLQEKCVHFNRELCKITLEAVAESGKSVQIAGDIGPSGMLVDPFCEITFSEKINQYKKQVDALEPYVDLFFVETMTTMSDMRAAALACRETGKPVFVCISVDSDGNTFEQNIPAKAALITLQTLGVSAFGINCSSHNATLKTIRELLPYAEIPLIAKPAYFSCNDCTNGKISGFDAKTANLELISCGVKYIGGCCGSTAEDIAELTGYKNYKSNVPLYTEKEDLTFIFTFINQVFYLEPDTTEISKPIPCFPDMEDIITEICHQSFDILRVAVNTEDDALDFSRNAHMSTLPVMFISDSEVALEKALLLYQGRALVDSMSAVPEENLKEIALKYGAVLY